MTLIGSHSLPSPIDASGAHRRHDAILEGCYMHDTLLGLATTLLRTSFSDYFRSRRRLIRLGRSSVILIPALVVTAISPEVKRMSHRRSLLCRYIFPIATQYIEATPRIHYFEPH